MKTLLIGFFVIVMGATAFAGQQTVTCPDNASAQLHAILGPAGFAREGRAQGSMNIDFYQISWNSARKRVFCYYDTAYYAITYWVDLSFTPTSCTSTQNQQVVPPNQRVSGVKSVLCRGN